MEATIRPEVEESCGRLESNGRNSLSGLFLSNMDPSLTGAELRRIERALKSNGQLRYLSLSGSLLQTDNNAPDATVRSFLDTVLTHESVMRLDLGHCCLGDRYAAVIGEALPRASALKVLILDGNDFGVEGAKSIADGLSTNRTLDTLRLSDNLEIGRNGAEGCRALSVALEKNLFLKSLALNGCAVSDEGVAALSDGLAKNKSLDELYLTENCIGDDGARSIASALARNGYLTELHLEGNRIASDGAAALERALEHANGTLEELWLSGRVGGGRGTGVGAAGRRPQRQHNNEGIDWNQRYRIRGLCQKNRNIKRSFELLMKNNPHELPLCLWPQAFQLVRTKPTLIHQVMRARPDLCS